MVYPSKRVALRGLVLLVTAAVLGLGLAIPGQVAAVDHGPVRVTPRTLPPGVGACRDPHDHVGRERTWRRCGRPTDGGHGRRHNLRGIR